MPSNSNYTFTITTDKLHNFFRFFDKLGDKQKKVLHRLIWYYKKYPNAHPTQEKIAKGISASREYVNRTISLFKKEKLIWLISRGRCRAKEIRMEEWLASVDFINRQWFKRVEITSKVTHSYSSYRRIASYKTGAASPPLKIPFYLQKLDISLDAKLKLSMVSEGTYHEALHRCRKRAAKGFNPKKAENYMVGTAILLARENGEKLNWRGYYSLKN